MSTTLYYLSFAYSRMRKYIITIELHFLLLVFVLLLQVNSLAFPQPAIKDSASASTREEAVAMLNKITEIAASEYWPNIQPDLFLENLKRNIAQPLTIYEGSYLNFCGYAALSYIPLHYDPVGYVKFILELYSRGKSQYGNVLIHPSKEVMAAAGTIKFKGILDINHADQMWFLSLADHFKGYLNWTNSKYNTGDERTFWAAVNFAKFNRMVSTLFNYQVQSTGSDVIRPKMDNVYSYLKKQLETGITFLYVDNYILTLKKHHFLRPSFPTHFIVLLDINYVDGLFNITYWDYGFRTFIKVTPAFLKKIIFGISHCTKA